MKRILLASAILLLSLAPIKAYADKQFSYINNQKAMAYCTSESIGLESMISVSSLVKLSKTPKELELFIVSQAKRLGTDSMSLSTVEKEGVDAYKQSFYLSNSLTSYSVGIVCVWSSKIVY